MRLQGIYTRFYRRIYRRRPRAILGSLEGGKVMGKGNQRLDEGAEVSGAGQGRSRKNRMVGFVQMARKKLMEKNAEIREDW